MIEVGDLPRPPGFDRLLTASGHGLAAVQTTLSSHDHTSLVAMAAGLEAWVAALFEAVTPGIDPEAPEEAFAIATWCVLQGAKWCQAMLDAPQAMPKACPDPIVIPNSGGSNYDGPDW